MATSVEFAKLKSDLGRIFDGDRLLWLKFCLFEYLSIGVLTKKNSIANDFFNTLHDTGKIEPNNVKLLLEIATLSELKEAEDLVLQYIRDSNAENTEEEKISSRRKFMFKKLQNVDPGALKRVIAYYDLERYNYTNIWDVTFRLETYQSLSKEPDKKKDVFNDLLQQVVHHRNVPQRSASHGGRCEYEYDDGKTTDSNRQTEEKIELYLLSKQETLLHNAKTFTPAILNKSYQVDIYELFTDLDLLKGNAKNKNTQSTTLQNVLATIKSTPACKVLIDGEGGIGKTTLLRYIAYNASTDKSFDVFKGKIVFLLKVRDLEKGILDLMVDHLNMEEFDLETDLGKDSKVIKKFILKHNDKIVLLLDGLDEKRFENKDFIRLFRRETLKNSVVILTSRTGNIDEFINVCDLHVKVKGFSQKSIVTYIDRYFMSIENPDLGKSLKDELRIEHHNCDIRFLNFPHHEIRSMCKNPMLLLSICIMWEENQNLPRDKSDLFKEIFRTILNQYIGKQQCTLFISKFDNAPVEYVNAMILLGKYMYRSLKCNQLSIYKADLTAAADNNLVDLALKLGFVYEDAPISKCNFEQVYMPPHKLITESLVGFYLYKKCESINSPLLAPLDENEWKEIGESKHFNMTIAFAIGFLGADADKFFKHWITNDLSTYRCMCSYLGFVKQDHMDTVEQALINHMSETTLEIQNLEDISMSLRMFIRKVKNDDTINGHFIHLITQLHTIYNPWNNLKMFCNEFKSDCNGRVLGHLLCILPSKNTSTSIISDRPPLLDMAESNLSGVVMNAMITECSNRGVTFILSNLNISENNLCDINGTLLGTLLIMSPKLDTLDMHGCDLPGNVLYAMIKECSNAGGNLSIRELNISENNLGNIDGYIDDYGNSLGSLLVMSPSLYMLKMHTCNLSGGVINAMFRACLNAVHLKLSVLDISGNDLSNMEGTLLGSVISTSLLPGKLDMHSCNLSGNVMNAMIRECSNRDVKLTLSRLHIRCNNLCNIDSTLLRSLVKMSRLFELDIRQCNLSCTLLESLKHEFRHINVAF